MEVTITITRLVIQFILAGLIVGFLALFLGARRSYPMLQFIMGFAYGVIGSVAFYLILKYAGPIFVFFGL